MIQSGYSLADLEKMDEATRQRQLLGATLLGSMAPRKITSPGQGLMQLAETALNANTYRNSMFPDAPGGAKPSFSTQFKNFMTGGNNGGLY
jgi:hypothetical protein